ncbi:MAG: phosphoenolpyruvate--protein phosphotransferase [Planctomycetota bacterium]
MSEHLLLLDDIARIIGESSTLQGVLDRVVRLVAQRMKTDMCSIWLLDGSATKLTLSATHGLNQEAIGFAQLEKGHGLTWKVLLSKTPVMIEDAPRHPDYIYLPVTKEEEFHSLLGLPLQVRASPIGALTVQTREPRRFSRDEIRALSAIASQIAPVVDNARLLALIDPEEKPGAPPARRAGPRRFMGTPCSVGIVSGEILRMGHSLPPAPPAAGTVLQEYERLDRACVRARAELMRMQEWLRERNAEEAALIFSVQLMLLEDPTFEGRLHQAIEEGTPAYDAVRRVTQDFIARFARLDAIYFRERASDVRDLAARLLRHVGANDSKPGTSLDGKIAVLPLLAPSRMVSLCAEGAAAVLTGGGGATSHAALLARSLDLPLVVGLGDFVNDVRNGQHALVDAASGEVVIDPPDHMIEEAQRAALAGVEALHKLESPKTKGSGRIRFEANVSLWGDAVRARDHDADGIGLYRTEFAFLMRPDLPAEEEQYGLYRRVVDTVSPRPVTFRFLDAGGDKLVPALAQAPEPNPFLGYRSLRLLLDNPDILIGQARAILRALEGTQGRLLVPMVGSVDEFKAIRRVLMRETEELPPLGALIELPSALFELDELAEEADFLGVGTNDLCQHLLGVDRTNARVARFCDPCHPAVVRALKAIREAARRADKPMCVCGEAASNPLFLPLWLGLGVSRLSVHATRIGVMRALEERLDREEAEGIVDEILGLTAAHEIRSCLESVAAPEVIEFVAVRRGR